MNQSSKAKCCFCEKPDIAALMVSGFTKKLKPRLACVPCERAYREFNASAFTWHAINATTPAIDTNSLNHDSRQQLKVNLEYCACGHTSKQHEPDDLGNLLHCSKCDDCDHFWYAVPQTRNTDLIVLSAAEISAEPTVIDKLRAMAEDDRTNRNERIAAAQRMVAMLEKEAA